MRTLTGLLVILALTQSAQAGELRAGVATVDITPPVGTPMAGYYSLRAAEGTHDPLLAKALVIEKDGVKAALVALDLISTTRSLVEEARGEIERVTGIPGGHVMISATHSHTGPLLSSQTLRDIAIGGQSELTARFGSQLPGKVAQAVNHANAQLRPVSAFTAHGREESIAFNRRFHMRDGSVGWNPGVRNPRIVKPAGTIDPDVAVVVFGETARKPSALYVNYAVHLDTVGGAQYSADMPYYLSKALDEVLGPKLTTVYTTACCGDVNHIDVSWDNQQKGFSQAARMGTILAAEVLRSLPHAAPSRLGRLRAKSAIVALPLAKLEQGDVEKAQELVGRPQAPGAARIPFLDQVKSYRVLDVAARQGKPHQVEVQVVALGPDLAWVSLPGEIFVELGLAIKQDSPFANTIIAELANGSIGYIPSRRAYAQGNYEVVSSRCAEGSGELLVDAALRLLKELHAAGETKQ